jgi:hypothetical protein
MSESDRKRAPLILVGLVVLAFVGTGVIALNYNPHGLEPGDVYSQGLDVERNEHTTGVRLITVYGQEVIASPSLLRQAQLGPRHPRVHLAVIPPKGALVNGTGIRSEHGQDRSILRETLSWSATQTPNDLNNTIERTLTYEYDGRKQQLNIGSHVFPLTDGRAFVALLDEGWMPTVRRVNQDLDVLPISEEQRNALRDFFVNENKANQALH